MKPQDFVKEFVRMCEYYKHTNIDDDCKACPMLEKGCWSEDVMDMNHPEKFAEAYNIVAKWSDEHPVKTRQSEFLKLFPNAVIDEDDGILGIKPCYIDESIGCTDEKGCDGCRRKYWLTEVPDND